ARALLRIRAREPWLQDPHQDPQGPNELLRFRRRFTAQGSGWNRRMVRRLRLGVGLVRPTAHLRLRQQHQFGGVLRPEYRCGNRHARSLQTSDPEAASKLWSKIDRDIVDRAVWVAFLNTRSLDVISSRVGDYQYNPQWGVLLD